MKEQKNPFANMAVDIVKRGTKITLPADPREMSEMEAIECLERKIRANETAVGIHEEVDAFPLDGAYALMKVLELRFGWASAVPTPGFFGPKPPTMVNLEVGVNQNAQVIWGGFAVPGIEGNLQTGQTEKRGKKIFVISGTVKKKHQEEIKEIAQAVRDYVRESSVYRSQAIKLHTDDSGDMDFDNPPSFLDLSRVNPEELVFPKDVQEQIETNLFTPVEHTEACRKYKIPLKRGVLLEGKYGTGKTLTAFVTAQKATANGWTFIYLDRVTALQEVIQFAKQYSPAVVFAEDIDRVLDGDRDMGMDDILNTIDGIDAKNSEILVILTTNHVEKIEKAMMRPGRLDAVISVVAPDAEAAEKLVRIYARGLVKADEDLSAAGKELNGQIPAVIREVVERSKLFAVRRSDGTSRLKISGEDITKAAKGMKNHLDLMDTKEKPKTLPERVGMAFTDMICHSVENSQILNGAKEKIDIIHDRVN